MSNADIALAGLSYALSDSVDPLNRVIYLQTDITEESISKAIRALQFLDGLGGDIEVLFKIGDEEKPTNAFAGQPLSEVAAQVRCHRPLAPPRRDAGRRLRGAVDTTIVLRAGGRRDPVQVQKGRVRDVQGND